VTAPLVALERAAVGYGGQPLLRDVALAVVPGDFVAIVGPNGGGKTTILRALLGVLPLMGGERVQPGPLRIGYVPQRDHVDAYWPLTVAEVALMGRYRRVGPARRPGPADREAVAAALARVGIDDLVRAPSARSRAASGSARSSRARSRASPSCSRSTSRRTAWTRRRSSTRWTCCARSTTAGGSRS